MCEAGVCRHEFTNCSLNMTANCVFASAHSRGGRFHSAVARFKTKYNSFVAASSEGKCPLVLTARRSLEPISDMGHGSDLPRVLTCAIRLPYLIRRLAVDRTPNPKCGTKCVSSPISAADLDGDTAERSLRMSMCELMRLPYSAINARALA